MKTPVRGRLLLAAPFALVAILVVVGLVLIGIDRWRRGASVMAIAALLGAVVRLLLPPDRAGLLEVRSKQFDVGTLTVIGLGLGIAAWGL